MDKVISDFHCLKLNNENNENERNTSDMKKISATKTIREVRKIIEELCSTDTENLSKTDSVASVNDQDSEDEDFDDFEECDDNEPDSDFDTKAGNKKDALELLIDAKQRNIINDNITIEQLRNCSQDKDSNPYNTFCKSSPEGYSPLYIAVFCNMTKVSEFLVNQIYYHVFPSSEEAIRYLNHQDCEGNTVIHEMAYMGDKVAPTLDMLLKFKGLYYGQNVTLFDSGVRNISQEIPIHFSLRSCLNKSQHKTIAIFCNQNPDVMKALDKKGNNLVEFLIKICLESYPVHAHDDSRDMETIQQCLNRLLSYPEMNIFIGTSLKLLNKYQTRIQPVVYSKIHSCLKAKEEDGIQILHKVLPTVMNTKYGYENQKTVTLSKRDGNDANHTGLQEAMEIPLVVEEFYQNDPYGSTSPNESNSPTLPTAHLMSSQHSLPPYTQAVTQYSQNPPTLYSETYPASTLHSQRSPAYPASTQNSQIAPSSSATYSQHEISTSHFQASPAIYCHSSLGAHSFSQISPDAPATRSQILQISPSCQPPISFDPRIYDVSTTHSLMPQNLECSHPQIPYSTAANFSLLHSLVPPSQVSSSPAMTASFTVSYTQGNQTHAMNTITVPESGLVDAPSVFGNMEKLKPMATTLPSTRRYQVHNITTAGEENILIDPENILIDPDNLGEDKNMILQGDLDTSSCFTTLNLSDIFAHDELNPSSQSIVTTPQTNWDMESLFSPSLNTPVNMEPFEFAASRNGNDSTETMDKSA